MEISPESGALVADFLQRNLPSITNIAKNILKGASDKVKLRLNNTYRIYLEAISKKYGRSKSFFIRDAPANIYDFYIPLGVTIDDTEFPKVEYSDVVNFSKRAVVTGPAGSGKSMLMRHFLLSCLSYGNRVPVFVELRNANADGATVKELIRSSLKLHGFTLDEAFVEKALEAGHFAILLDGFDELAHPRRQEVTQDILELSQAAPECTIIVSSRPDDSFGGWEEFSSLDIRPLNKEEAIQLVQKLPFDEEIKGKFVEEIDRRLFTSHESFLSNPLLLSIMLLTYGQSADIPTKLSIFYNQAYEALFQRHDALKGGFQRDRQCRLDIQDFGKIFAAFCVQTYDRRLFEFSRSDAIGYLKKAKSATGLDFNVNHYLFDSLQSTCLLVEDGIRLVFAHRSFQEYFVAKFIAEAAPENQPKLIDLVWSNMLSDSVMDILYELNPDLVERHFLVPKLNQLFMSMGVKKKIGITHFTRYLKIMFETILVTNDSIFASINNTPPGYFNVVRYVFNSCWSREGIEEVVYNEKKRNRFIKKYFIGTKNSEYPTSKMSARSVFIQDFVEVGRLYSVVSLNKLYLWKKELESRRKHVGRSLDELLSS